MTIYFAFEVIEFILKKDFYQISACSLLNDSNITRIKKTIHTFEANNSPFIFKHFIAKNKTEIINILTPIETIDCKNQVSQRFISYLYHLNKEIHFSNDLYKYEYFIVSKLNLAIKKLNTTRDAIAIGVETEKIYFSDLKKICNLKSQHEMLTKHISKGNVCRQLASTKNAKPCQTSNFVNRIAKDKENFQTNYSLFRKKWLHLNENENSDEICKPL
jgi:hypothetical protein